MGYVQRHVQRLQRRAARAFRHQASARATGLLQHMPCAQRMHALGDSWSLDEGGSWPSGEAGQVCSVRCWGAAARDSVYCAGSR